MKSKIWLPAIAGVVVLVFASCVNPLSSKLSQSNAAAEASRGMWAGRNDHFDHGPNGLPPVPSNLSITVNRIRGLSPWFMKGADVSMLAQIEKSGGVFYGENGKPGNPLEILKNHGVNWVRLRIWNNPVFPPGTTSYYGTPVSPGPAGGGNDNEQVVLGLAKQATRLGLRVFLDFHYSDFWADPGKQNIPAAWASDSPEQLQRDVYRYTRKVMSDLKAEGATPGMVELGNEVNNGFLWPIGKIGGSGNSAADYTEFIKLLNAGARAVREVSPFTKIVIHIANSGGTSGDEKFFDHIVGKVDFNYIGLSYYPYWHGTLANFKKTVDALAARYHRRIVVAETAYAWTNRNADGTANSWSGNSPTQGGFAVSVQGQATAIRDIMAAVAHIPDNLGLGVFYWEPDWIPVNGAGWVTGQGDGWENQTWWNFQGRPLQSMWTYRLVSEPHPYVAATVTSIPVTDIKTTVGTAPTLPATVQALFSDGSYQQVAVTWNTISPSQYDSPGTFTVDGTVQGSNIMAQASVTVSQVNYVVNGGFEAGQLSPWVTSATSGGAAVSGVFTVEQSSPSGDTHSGSYTGSYYYGSPYTFDVHQQVTGLQPGTYTLSAWVMGADGTAGVNPVSLDIYADNGTKATANVTNTGWQAWHQYTISGITVGSSGQLTVGFEGNMHSGDWGKLDDVTLTKQ